MRIKPAARLVQADLPIGFPEAVPVEGGRRAEGGEAVESQTVREDRKSDQEQTDRQHHHHQARKQQIQQTQRTQSGRHRTGSRTARTQEVAQRPPEGGRREGVFDEAGGRQPQQQEKNYLPRKGTRQHPKQNQRKSNGTRIKTQRKDGRNTLQDGHQG